MRANPAGASDRAALARRRRAPPSAALERASNAGAPGPTGALPQVLRVVRPGLGRAERGPAADQGATPRNARGNRSSAPLLLPRAPRGDPEARADRREARGIS